MPGSIVPVFPLPKAFLFPYLYLPLHVFEPRYKQMAADVIEGEKLMAVSIVTGGSFEDPEPHHICGVGVVEDYEELADGKKNILLRGITRARIDEIIERRPYITARITPLSEEVGDPDALDALGNNLRRLLAEIIFLRDDLSDDLLTRVGMMTHPGVVADFVTLYFIDDAAIKQELLETVSVPDRARRVEELMQDYLRELARTQSSQGA